MAGIGFSLKKLFNRKGVLNLCRAYGYAGLICAGPMILGVLLLVGVSLVGMAGGMSEHDRQLMNAIITYSLLASLVITGIFNMVNTRYVSDMLYEEKPELVMPSLHGALLIILPASAVIWAIFLLFCGVDLLDRVCCFWFFCILLVVWMEMNYLNALKDYRALVRDFALSLGLGLLICIVLLFLHAVNIETLLLSVIVSYGLLMSLYYRRLLRYFPQSQGSPFRFLRWFDKYRSLAFIGFFVNIGLFGHLVVMYFGPAAEHIQGLFYCAPMHDVAALCAFFSILITTINFVTSVETNFYPRYHTYYSLYNDGGSILDIDQAETEMLTVLKRELEYNGIKQLICTLLFVVLGSIFLQNVLLGFTDTSLSIFRILCVGYALYALSNTQMLVLLYYEDYQGALWATAAFAAVSILGSILQILVSPIEIFGLGFLAGGVAFYVITWARLEWYTQKLAYFLLGRQALVPHAEQGLFSRICDNIETREAAKEALAE